MRDSHTNFPSDQWLLWRYQRAASSARFTADGPSSSISVNAGTNTFTSRNERVLPIGRQPETVVYFSVFFVFFFLCRSCLVPAAMYLFDPLTLAAATAADDATRADQLSVDGVGCKYRLRPLCLTDYARGRYTTICVVFYLVDLVLRLSVLIFFFVLSQDTWTCCLN